MNTQQYAVITGSYWAFTLTDGALRMLVVLFFHGLGYSPLDIALLFFVLRIVRSGNEFGRRLACCAHRSRSDRVGRSFSASCCSWHAFSRRILF